MSNAWLPLCVLLVSACEAETIVAAEDPRPSKNSQDGGDEAGDDGGVFDCQSDSDCADNDFCAKPSCRAPRGRCRAKALSCNSEDRPVCGCDGITYLNDCLREQYGVNLAAEGRCNRMAMMPCGGPRRLSCPGRATCFQSIDALSPEPPPCPPTPPPGSCWMLPSECNQVPMGGGSRFARCGQRECLDFCNALAGSEGNPIFLVDRCRR